MNHSDDASLKYYEYFTVNRSPQEIRDLLDWTASRIKGKSEHDEPFAYGVAAAMEYMLYANSIPPQMYKGDMSLENIMRDSEPANENVARCAGCVHRLRDIEHVRCCIDNPRKFSLDEQTISWIQEYKKAFRDG